jgi:serine/threonine protein kinase
MTEPTHEPSPTSAVADEELLGQLADDFAVRRRQGEHPTVEEYVARYPPLADRIRNVLSAVGMIEQTVPPDLTPGERPGSTIGRYKLLERIGEGGFGVVYMAEQITPVRRKVALKVVKPGMDSRQVLARFEAERQALALMEHENIAKVLDAGATDTGRPYFVMELVKGVPITEFCDQQQLEPRQRLELFAHVCNAVQHAHQKGIIHRDIKPSNILVMMHDTTPVVKVIDFGVAKALGQELTDKTLFTGFAQLLGTPLYMSPEQAGESAIDVDTRSDIYSLGVLLYELLTGTTPFDKERFKKAAQDEIRRIIREEEPPRPSTRLSESKDSLPSISAQRHTEPAKLTKLVRGELDWIVMKALEKDRSRRYETANGLARDVERYLNDEAVQASPPSGLYRVRKFVRRHKGPVVAAGAVVLALLLGVAAATVGFLQATRQRAIAQANESNARAEAGRADRESQRAQSEAHKASTVNEFLLDMLASASPVGLEEIEHKRGRNVTVYELLTEAVEKLDGGSLKNSPETEAVVRRTMGRSYYGLGQNGDAEKQFREALRLFKQVYGPEHADVAGMMVDIARTLPTNKHTEQETLIREALAMSRKLSPNKTTVSEAEALGELASALRARGKLAEAEELARQALAMKRKLFGPKSVWLARGMRTLAMVLTAEWKLEEAEELYLSALEIQRAQFGQGHLALASTLNGLAYVRQLQGRTADAEQMYRQILAMQRELAGEENPFTLTQLAKLLHAQGKLAEAESLYRAALTEDTKLLGSNDPMLARRMIVLAEVLQAQKKLPEAKALYQQALAFQRRVLGDADHNVQTTVAALIKLLQEDGTLAQAEPMLRELLSSQRKMLGETHLSVAETLSNLALSLRAAGNNAEAALVDEQAAAIRATPRPASTSPADVAEARLSEADVLIQSRSFVEAEALLLKVRLRAPGGTRAKARDKLIELYRVWGQPEKASELLGQRVQSAKMTPGSGRVVNYQLDYAQSLIELARFQPAEAVLKEAYAAATETEKPMVAQRLTALYQAWNKPEQRAEWQTKAPPAESPATMAPVTRPTTSHP